MEKFNFAFWGTPLISSKTLEILKENGYIPSIIITSPDKKRGRGLSMHESPVSLWAKEHNIKCLKPEKVNQDFIDMFDKLNINLSIVVAYGKILPEKIIKIPTLGTINIHYSLLPKYRGASPLEASLLNGDIITGVSIQQMEFKLDSGPILIEKEINIDIDENKDELKDKLIILGGDLLCEIIPKIINNELTSKLQNESHATYCSKIRKEDGEININGDQKENYNKYRAFYGWPGTYFFIIKKDKKIRIKINKAVYENNLFIIKRVTPEGKKEINYTDFLRQN
ncbi:MAG: methionyl-tRNA formyltransferase [Candidatus Paceibacterota bacterium]